MYRVLAHFSGWHSRIIQGYFKDEIIIFKYNCAPNYLRCGKEYMGWGAPTSCIMDC